MNKLDFIELNIDSVQVLSTLSKNMHEIQSVVNLTEDSDDEEDVYVKSQQDEYLTLMNRQEKVRRWLHFLNTHQNNWDVLSAFTKLCHNLLLVYKDSIRKFL